MTLNITERDKKLLIILAFFLILVGGGAGILMPLMNTAQVVSQQLEDARLEQMEKQQKVAMVPVLTKKREELTGSLIEAQGIFYEQMPSKDIDKMLTGMAVEAGLYVQDLSISMPYNGEYVSLQSYPAMLQQKLGIAGANVSEDPVCVYSGVYSAGVSMVMTGPRPLLQAMVDECAQLEPKLRITGISWQKSSREAGEEYTLSLTLDIYMYQELSDYLAESLMAPPSSGQGGDAASQEEDVDDYLME